MNNGVGARAFVTPWLALAIDFLRSLHQLSRPLAEPRLSTRLWRRSAVRYSPAAGFAAHWSPLSGRIKAFGYALDAIPFVGVGFGIGGTRISCPPDAVVYTPTTLRPIGILSAGARFRLSEAFGLRLEVKDHIYVSRVVQDHLIGNSRVGSGVRHQVLSHIGLSFFF